MAAPSHAGLEGESIHRIVASTLVGILAAVPLVAADAGLFGDGHLDCQLVGSTLDPGSPRLDCEPFDEDGGGEGDVPIVVVGSETWAAEEPSEVDMTVAEQTVLVHIRFLVRTSVESVTVCVGETDGGGTFTSHGCDTEQGGPDLENVVEFAVDVPEHTIATGERPAVQMSVDVLGTGTGAAVIQTGPSSAVHYTACPPPESGTCPD